MDRSQRLHYLDFTRGMMMLLGVVVHASHADYDLGRYEALRFFSGSFRMACFFVISGYFAPMLLERLGTRVFLWKRLVALGVPALFAVLLLNPPSIAAIWEYFGTAPVPTEPTINWHVHVWFLFVLMAYMCATPLLLRALAPLAARFRADGSARFEALALVLVTMLSGVGLKLVEKLGTTFSDYDLYAGVVEPIFANLPFFVLGVLMRRSRAVFEFVHSKPWLWAGCAVVLLVARHSAEQSAIKSTVEHLAHLGVDFACGFACSFALLGLARRVITGPRRWVELVSESAYTVYIVHYLVIALFLVQAQRWGLSVPARAVAAAVLATAVGFGLHVGLVRRFRLAAFLLNGRLPAPSASPAPAPAIPSAAAGALVLASNPLAAAVETITNARVESGPEVAARVVPSADIAS
jgi:peptidoglycan/LPS O-acetylase OafA/YrhL